MDIYSDANESRTYQPLLSLDLLNKKLSYRLETGRQQRISL